MKVVLAVDALLPPLTGIGRYAFELARRLPALVGERGVRYYDAGHWVTDSAAMLRRARETVPPGTEPQRPATASRRWPRWVRRHIAPAYWRHSLKGCVFHGPNYFLPAAADKGVITVHDLSVYRYPQMHPEARLRDFDKHFEESLRRARHVITDAQAIRSEVIERYGLAPTRVTAIPLGVSAAFAPRGAAETASVMKRLRLVHGEYTLCVATLEPRKNLDKLLQAYATLPNDVRTRHPLALIGAAGWRSDALHAAVDRARDEGWLIPCGYLGDDELGLVYAGARLFAFPSVYEGFGLPVLEAMASGVPVVTSNRSSLPEVAGDAALLVDPDDIDGLATQLHRGLTDELWRSGAIERGRRQAAHHSWQRCAESTVDVYRAVNGT